ncbi:MAG: 2-oxo acid dehydrogenase subunit E2 [Gemmataceae bacterium]|nr:2-oxo acid dehydrogenase subunit E2 [Gemmataceae bacterium]MCI0743450.1 2-oxo acid dehydrogenase subunit E2 [Gemmataceae bacterium]
MPNEVKLPALGENIPGGDVVEVKVKVGDVVKEGQSLVEVEAEKSTLELPSPFAGSIAQVMVKKGDKVQTGQTLFLIDSKNGQAAAAKPPPPPSESKTPKVEASAKPQAVVSETPKTSPVTSDSSPPKGRGETPALKPPSGDGIVVPAGPATRKLAREWGVDLVQVPGTGPLGRVTQDDVKAYIRSLATTGGGARVQAAPLPSFEQWGPVEAKPFDSIRKKTADLVSLSWSLVPHVTHHDQADVSEIEAFRKQQEGKGPKLTVTAFVLKACAIVLKEHSQFNASLDVAKGQLVYKHYYHLGVAVDTERGLLVPVLRDVDKKSVHDIGREMAELAERARLKKITADDLRGGSFTISNLGGIGGTAFTPIVNYPEVAILGLSRSRTQPVWKDGQFAPRLILPLSLSYDHRVIDGAAAARFTRRLADMLENPLVMLLHA